MAPATGVNNKTGFDCGLVKQPEAKIRSTTTGTPIDVVESKTGSQETHNSTKTTTTTTTSTTESSFGEWKYKGATESKTFVCEFPPTSANVNRVLEPLPFPKKLKDVIAWTNAFVERIAIATVEQEQSTTTIITKKEEEVGEWRKKFDHKQDEVHQREETITSQKGEIDRLKRELEKSQTIVREKETTIKTLEHDKRIKAIEHEKEIQKWVEENDRDDADIANRDEHIKRDHEKLEDEIKHRMDVESKLREAETRIAGKDTEIQSLRDEVDRLRSEVAKQVARVRKLEIELRLSNEGHGETNRKLNETNETTKKLGKELAEARTSLSESEKKHNSHVEECARSIKYLEGKVSELAIRRDTLEREGAGYLKEIGRLTTEVEIKRSHLTTAETKLSTVRTELTTTRTQLTTVRTELETKKRDLKRVNTINRTADVDVDIWRNRYNREKKDWDSEKEELGQEIENSKKKLEAVEEKSVREKKSSEHRIKELRGSVEELTARVDFCRREHEQNLELEEEGEIIEEEEEEEATSKTTTSFSSSISTTTKTIGC